MVILLNLFWISLVILFFCYLGYGLFLLVIRLLASGFSNKKKQVLREWLPVTLVVTAYNESAVLEEKIRNTFEIEYPAELFHIIFITDGSVDNSAALLSKYPAIIHLHDPERRGKMAAIKRAMRAVDTPVVVFSDANSMLNKECIYNMVSHYQDPRVGGVAGEKKIMFAGKISAVGEAEGIYWQYESFLKKLDASFHTVVGAAGELFSIRTKLFTGFDDQVILDDFLISMQVCLQGYKISYEPGAYALEFSSVSLREEEKRKIRISAGAYQSISYLTACLNFLKYPLLGFQYVSRRLLRWVFCPVLLGVLFITNILIVYGYDASLIYSWFLAAQASFYCLAFVGWLLVRKEKRAGLLAIPFYFVFMNYCLVRGFIRFLKGKQSVLWEKSIRQEVKSVSQ